MRLETSASSRLNLGVEPLEFDTRILNTELPIDTTLFGVCFVGPGSDLCL